VIQKKVVGLSLIELMVVLFIMGIVSTLATPFMNLLSTNNTLKKEAKRLHRSLILAQQESFLSFKTMGIIIHDRGYRFVQYEPQHHRWQSLNRVGIYQPIDFPEPIHPALEDRRLGMRLALYPDNPDLKPQIVIYDNGTMTPFRMLIKDPNSGHYERIYGKEDDMLVVSTSTQS
jgi:general secretion pathway protein H